MSQDSLSPATLETRHSRRKHAGGRQWALALLPLAAHFAMSAATVTFMVVYVSGRPFGIRERRASFVESNGSRGTVEHPTPLQTDITTLLSVALALTRMCGGCWCTAMCSRCAFLLLEKDGMYLKDLAWMFDWGLPASFTSKRKGSNSRIVLITGIILLASLPAQYAAPLLTGSITWSPSYGMVSGSVAVSNISVGRMDIDSYAWWQMNLQKSRIRAAAIATATWSAGATSGGGLMKRIVAPAERLSDNSTLNNITLPYFRVHSLTWLTDISHITRPNLRAAIDFEGGLLNISSVDNPLLQSAPTLAIIPNEPYFNQMQDAVANPQPTIMKRNTGVLALFAYGREYDRRYCTSEALGPFGYLPSDVAFLEAFPGLSGIPDGTDYEANCYIFANVTYSAGAALCTDCRVASGGVVERDVSALTLHEDVATVLAFSLMSEVIATMALMNVSIPNTWNNTKTYTREMLMRSYAASWTAATDAISRSYESVWSETGYETSSLTTKARIAVPDTIAIVAFWRVVLWLGMQMLSTFSALIFIATQLTSRKGLVAHPMLEWFLLDTHEVKGQMDIISAGGKGGVMRLTKGGDFSVIRHAGDGAIVVPGTPASSHGTLDTTLTDE